jgi:hypothetical protein
MVKNDQDTSTHCLYHKATEYRIGRVEERMNRIEKFILGMLIYLATIQAAIILNLPQKLMDHENRARAEDRK